MNLQHDFLFEPQRYLFGNPVDSTQPVLKAAMFGREALKTADLQGASVFSFPQKKTSDLKVKSSNAKQKARKSPAEVKVNDGVDRKTVDLFVPEPPPRAPRKKKDMSAEQVPQKAGLLAGHVECPIPEKAGHWHAQTMAQEQTRQERRTEPHTTKTRHKATRMPKQESYQPQEVDGDPELWETMLAGSCCEKQANTP